MENNLNTLRGAGFDIALEITWIACEVFVGSKLERVHEDAQRDNIGSAMTTNLSLVSVTNNRFPVVFSINCASGIFDNETVDLAPQFVAPGYGPSMLSTYFSEAFLRKSDGALAVIGDTRISSTTANNHMTLGLFDGIFPGLLP